jgi:hypothetical protein
VLIGWGEQADFHIVEKGVEVSNMISVGASDEELYITFSFGWEYPGVVEGSPEAEEKEEGMRRIGRTAVRKTIDIIRQMVVEGKL